MLIGEYRHTIDAKKRISLPSKFRKVIGKNVVVTHGLDHCLFVYPQKGWEQLLEKFKNLSMGQADQRKFNRYILGGAIDGEVDSMGRILIPDFLKSFAHLQNKVVLVGVNDRVEVWDEERWDNYKKQVEEDADMLAEKLGELGVI